MVLQFASEQEPQSVTQLIRARRYPRAGFSLPLRFLADINRDRGVTVHANPAPDRPSR